MKKYFKNHPEYKKNKKDFLNYRQLVISFEAENEILNEHKEKKKKFNNINDLFDPQERQLLFNDEVKKIEESETRIKNISERIKSMENSFDEYTIKAMQEFSRLDIQTDFKLENTSIDILAKTGIWVGCFIVYTILNLILVLLTGFTLGWLLTFVLFIFPAKKLCKIYNNRVFEKRNKYKKYLQY